MIDELEGGVIMSSNNCGRDQSPQTVNVYKIYQTSPKKESNANDVLAANQQLLTAMLNRRQQSSFDPGQILNDVLNSTLASLRAKSCIVDSLARSFNL